MASRVLLVEGADDRHVIWALLHAHDVPEVFQIEVLGGIERLFDSVPLRLRVASDLERHAPMPAGTIVQLPDGPRFGVWLMPNNQMPGILENFLAFLVPDIDSMLPHVDAFIGGIPTAERRFPESRLPKARVHAWLAVQEEPGKPLGQSITARYLDADAQVVGPFVNWLRAVLVD